MAKTADGDLYARVREEIALTKDPVRAICARHGVGWQAFYKHAAREGWPLRQRAKRSIPSEALLARLKDLLQERIGILRDYEPKVPQDPARPAPIHGIYAATLAQVLTIEKRERERRNTARKQKRANLAARAAELTRRLDELAAWGREEDARKAEEGEVR